MQSRLFHAARLLLLFFYGAYSLSPIYASASADCTDVCHAQRSHVHQYTMGIVWMNVLLSSLGDDEEIGGQRPAGETSLSAVDTDLILIKKKRAVLREQQPAPAPTATAVPTPPGTDSSLRAVHATGTPLDLKHRQSDGYSSLHAGLSPPQHLS